MINLKYVTSCKSHPIFLRLNYVLLNLKPVRFICCVWFVRGCVMKGMNEASRSSIRDWENTWLLLAHAFLWLPHICVYKTNNEVYLTLLIPHQHAYHYFNEPKATSTRQSH